MEQIGRFIRGNVNICCERNWCSSLHGFEQIASEPAAMLAKLFCCSSSLGIIDDGVVDSWNICLAYSRIAVAQGIYARGCFKMQQLT